MYKVLVLDDEADMAEFVGDAADALGFDVSIATDASSFSSKFSRNIDIVILDLFMPDMDGIEIIRFIHDNRSRPAVVFMSGKDMSILHSAQELAEERGLTVLGTLQKPFTVDDLDEALQRYRPNASTATTPQSSEGSDPITERDLIGAFEGGLIRLAYQPQFNLASGRLVGVEALARWPDPKRGMISPGLFIPMAEQMGLISRLTELVICEGAKQLALWRSNGLDVTLSLNISPITIVDLDLPERLGDLALQNGLPTDQIMIEITETAVMEDVPKFMDILTRLRMKGFGLSIDDFGTGYSSLQQLVRLPFSELKIDQAFVRPMLRDRECMTVTRMSIMLAHELNMTVVAEGIEDSATESALRDLSCDLGQGFHLGRPGSAAAILEATDKTNSGHPAQREAFR